MISNTNYLYTMDTSSFFVQQFKNEYSSVCVMFFYLLQRDKTFKMGMGLVDFVRSFSYSM